MINIKDIKNNNKVIIDKATKVLSSIGKGIIATSLIINEVVKSTVDNVTKYYKDVTSDKASGDKNDKKEEHEEYKGGIN